MSIEDTAGETAGEHRTEEAEMMDRLQEEIRNLPVSDHLLYMMHSLSALAVGRMGLSPDAETKKDLGQARLAIDAFKALFGVLELERPAEESSVHRGTLAQLQMAYVSALDGPRCAGSATTDTATTDSRAADHVDVDTGSDDAFADVQPDSGRPTE
jgi:hypothetical protein